MNDAQANSKIRFTYSRLKARAEKIRELRYIEAQRQQIWPWAIFICLVSTYVCIEFYWPQLETTAVVTEIIEEEPLHVSRLTTTAACLKVETDMTPPIRSGQIIRIAYSPFTNEVSSFRLKNQWFDSYFSYYEFRYFTLITACLAIVTTIGIKRKHRLWFQGWIATMIGLFICTLTYLITR